MEFPENVADLLSWEKSHSPIWHWFFAMVLHSARRCGSNTTARTSLLTVR